MSDSILVGIQNFNIMLLSYYRGVGADQTGSYNVQLYR